MAKQIEKPTEYALMGVEEYFAYPLNEQLVGTSRRLYDWQRDKATGQMRPTTLNSV